jgi:hypothetical protein
LKTVAGAGGLAIGKRPQEQHDPSFLSACQAQVSELPIVDRFGNLRGEHVRIRVSECIPPVIKINDVSKGCKEPVVPVRGGPGEVAQAGHLELADLGWICRTIFSVQSASLYEKYLDLNFFGGPTYFLKISPLGKVTFFNPKSTDIAALFRKKLVESGAEFIQHM